MPGADAGDSPRSTGGSSDADTALPPAQRRRTGDRMEGLADADASPPTATPSPQDAPTPMLDGAEMADFGFDLI